MPYSGPLYEAAAKMMEQGFREQSSLFTPGVAVWTREVAEDLKRRFVDSGDTSKASFMEKFERQLQGAPRATTQLV